MPPPSVNCIHCSKACKISDSRYYPNSKSKDRIHNRCYLKKSVADKLKPADNDDKPPTSEKPNPGCSISLPESKTSSLDLIKKLDEVHEKLKADAQSKKLKQLISEQEDKALKEREKSSFFFDVKAGIAKPHETRRYLSHRNLSEMAPRYDDHGFQSESIGRAYDHAGKDLNSLGDDSGDEAEGQSKVKNESAHIETKKRKIDTSDNKASKRVSQASVNLKEKSCWFCLSSPEVEKHLIVAIGNHCYLTLAKGGLVDEHFLLIPIEHIQSLHSKENTAELREELALFKSSLINYFKKKSLGVIFFERNFRSVHWQLQVIPISISKLQGVTSRIKSLSKKHYNKCDYLDIPSNCSLSDVIPPGSPYLYWRVEPSRERFVSKIELTGSFFPVQLPRIILADSEILDCKERIDWKKCTKTNDEYTQLVRGIKIEYSEFDFT